MILVILPVVLVLFGAVHGYLWKRLVRDVSAPRGAWRRTGTVLAVVLPLLSLGALVGGRLLPIAAERVLAWPGYLWLAVLLYLTLALLVGEAVRPLLRRALRGAATEAAPVPVPVGGPPEPRPEPRTESRPEPVPDGPSRRLFVARTVAVGAAVAATATVGHGTYGVLRGRG